MGHSIGRAWEPVCHCLSVPPLAQEVPWLQFAGSQGEHIREASLSSVLFLGLFSRPLLLPDTGFWANSSWVSPRAAGWMVVSWYIPGRQLWLHKLETEDLSTRGNSTSSSQPLCSKNTFTLESSKKTFLKLSQQLLTYFPSYKSYDFWRKSD